MFPRLSSQQYNIDSVANLVCANINRMVTAANTDTLYAQVSSLYCSDFTPSRETRVSSNPFLQEHLFGDAARGLRPIASTPLAIKSVPLKGSWTSLVRGTAQKRLFLLLFSRRTSTVQLGDLILTLIPQLEGFLATTKCYSRKRSHSLFVLDFVH